MGLWSGIKRVVLTDVRVLVRGMGRAELDAFERALIESDIGVSATMELVAAVTDEVRRGRLKTAEDVRTVLEDRLALLLDAADGKDPGAIAHSDTGPTVILMIGVNGSGKTTTSAKLAWKLKQEGKTVTLAACDTFRSLLRLEGTPPGAVDCLLAAEAVARRYPFVTRNVRHFERVNGLLLIAV